MKLTTGLVMTVILALSACATAPQPQPVDKHAARAASPASLNCLQNNGRLEVHHAPEGEKADCILPSGKRCDEWEMFRGNCPTRTVNVGMMNVLGF